MRCLKIRLGIPAGGVEPRARGARKEPIKKLWRVRVESKYLKMIQGMKKRGGKDWAVYILRCGDGSLYTGIAKDVGARVKQHCEGRGAAYTRTRLPVRLLYQEEALTRSEALIREAQIKAMPRSKKEEIIFRGGRSQ
jgi:predicted GIY-YIG superfamily endonuclease